MKRPEDRRERIVSVRLTEADYQRLAAKGRPSDVLRAALVPAAPRVVLLPVPTMTAPAGRMVWSDGTVGNTWPAIATG